MYPLVDKQTNLVAIWVNFGRDQHTVILIPIGFKSKNIDYNQTDRIKIRCSLPP